MKPRSTQQDLLKILKELESDKTPYPPDLLAARRAAFIDQLSHRTQVDAAEGLTPKDQEVVQRLKRLKSVEREYPLKLMAARRSAFRRQIAHVNRPGFWQTLRSAIQETLTPQEGNSSISSINLVLTSLIAVTFAVFAGFWIFGSLDQSSRLSPSQNKIFRPGLVIATTTQQVKLICKPGFIAPLCLAAEFDQSQDLIYQGNGLARPAVAKDTISDYGSLHKAAYVNDGLYGPGASWISDSPNSWIKIDLGKTTTINTVTFGRDRLGQLNDRDPGQFVIAVALADDVYADGNSSNDEREYTQVFNSEQVGFDGNISGAETVMAQFKPLAVRYIKITFQNAGTAVDEVEAFLKPPVLSVDSTKTPKDQLPGNTFTPLPTSTVVENTATPVPTGTPIPTDTATPIPTDTPLPTDTSTPIPTDTPLPTDTPTPISTDTPVPTDTPFFTDTPFPTDTPFLGPFTDKFDLSLAVTRP